MCKKCDAERIIRMQKLFFHDTEVFLLILSWICFVIWATIVEPHYDRVKQVVLACAIITRGFAFVITSTNSFLNLENKMIPYVSLFVDSLLFEVFRSQVREEFLLQDEPLLFGQPVYWKLVYIYQYLINASVMQLTHEYDFSQHHVLCSVFNNEQLQTQRAEQGYGRPMALSQEIVHERFALSTNIFGPIIIVILVYLYELHVDYIFMWYIRFEIGVLFRRRSKTQCYYEQNKTVFEEHSMPLVRYELKGKRYNSMRVKGNKYLSSVRKTRTRFSFQNRKLRCRHMQTLVIRNASISTNTPEALEVATTSQEVLEVATTSQEVLEVATTSQEVLEVATTSQEVLEVVTTSQEVSEISTNTQEVSEISTTSQEAVASHTTPEAFFDIGQYKMSARPKGLCVIINNRDFGSSRLGRRDGTDEDARKLNDFFTRTDFEVKLFENQTDSDMLEELKRISSLDHRPYDCFVCFILSHGQQESVYGTNGRPVAVSEVESFFSARQCRSLAKKPKLFFIQACQGNMAAAGVNVEDADHGGRWECDVTPEYPVHEYADFLTVFATAPGFIAYRNVTSGSRFVSVLLETMVKYPGRSFIDIVTMVTNKMDASVGEKQIPMFRSTLRKRVVLN